MGKTSSSKTSKWLNDVGPVSNNLGDISLKDK